MNPVIERVFKQKEVPKLCRGGFLQKPPGREDLSLRLADELTIEDDGSYIVKECWVVGEWDRNLYRELG